MNIKICKVRKDDWSFILKLRNDPTVRNACHDTSVIDFETHNKYMEKIKDSDIEIIPLWQLDEPRQEEVLTRLERIEVGIEELKTLQVGD